MCGIAGKLSWSQSPTRDVVKAMTDEMYLRGPDGEGLYSDDFVSLGHRRLSIIDLSEHGKQPMSDSTGRYWITFNGEIYNFQDIRKILESEGAQFRSNSDTEVILEAYKKWGRGCLEKLNGMFAFAIWDKEQHTLFIARDRLGKKPLYYYQFSDGSISFSSQIKALVLDPQIKKELNRKAVNQYLALGYVLSNQSIFKGVQKLEAAHSLFIEPDRPWHVEPYWKLEDFFATKTSQTEASASDELNALLDDATRIRMISDVPLGAFLSGGLDSSSIVRSMCNFKNSDNVFTCSIGFDEPGYSELSEASELANYLNVNHHSKTISPNMVDILRDIVYLADEPFSDNSMIPTYYLSQFAREKVTVALSGDGGDEIFAGYETYAADKWHRIFSKIPLPLLNFIASAADNLLPVTHNKVSFDYKLRQFLAGRGMDQVQAHYHWRTIFSDNERARLLKNFDVADLSEPLSHFKSVAACCDNGHWLDQAMYVDIKTWLVDDILVKADRMSMAHSLEVRCPFLDHRMVEFAASLPVDLKMKGFTKKYILKKSQEHRLPHSVIYRKKKGFNAPVAHWLNSSLRELAKDLSASGTIFSEVVDPAQVNSLIDDHMKKKADNNFKLLNLINLGLWLEMHFGDINKVQAPALASVALGRSR